MIIGVVIGLAVGLAIGIAWALVRSARVSGEARVVSGRLGDAQQRLSEAQASAAEQNLRLAGATAAAHEAETAPRRPRERTARATRPRGRGRSPSRGRAAAAGGNILPPLRRGVGPDQQAILGTGRHPFGPGARTAAQGDLTQRQDAIEQLLQPFRETLARYERGVQDMERQRQNAYSTLNERVAALREGHERLQQETHNLVTALRSPQTRGRWGEMTLRRAVEAAGMLEHVDFEEQHTTTSEGGLLRPDMVVHLPGGGEVVIDSKVPLDAFLHFTEAQNEEDRKSSLIKHGRQLRTHVEQLAKKEYWKQYDGSPEFVIAFIPGEPLLAAACEADATLQDYALNKRVVLATPNTLVAALRTIALSWRQDTLAANAREVKELGAELYERLRIWTGHMQSLQKSLASSVEAYNKAVGSLESRVLVTARKLPGLGVLDGASAQIQELAPIESSPRHLQAVELIDDEDETGESTLWSLPEGGASTGTGA